jgi:hypothetical protein|tara:strand:- start:45 stop:1463 length:1419 start_codon:yes stop_codon:yes gene_type:complete
MAKIGIEPSEVMASVAMLMSPADLNKYSKDMEGLVKFIKAGKELAKNENKVVYGAGLKQKALKAFNPTDRDFLTAAVHGISAARSIREWVPIRSKESGAVITKPIPDKVYLTGDKWPTAVQKFQVNAYGFKSYNSSDIIFQWKNPKGLSFYGISLKKKPSVQAPNPTLINKAFDSVLVGQGEQEIKELDKIKKEGEDERTKYFARVVREAEKAGYITLPKGQKLPDNNEALMKIRVYGEVKGVFKAKEKMALINLKGKGNLDLNNPLKQTDPNIFQIKSGKEYREFKKGEMKNKKISMRAFVNGKLASSDSIFNVMVEVMNKYSDKFAAALLNLVLKTNLYNELDENTFAFALVTGAGDIDKEGNPKNLSNIKAKGLYTILCGLSVLNKGPSKYNMILNDARNKKDVDPETGETEAGAAKVWLILKKGRFDILDLQLKYKGNFLGQPQFGATITDKFKNILTEEYGKKCEVP